jgi:hypothetical protein
VSISAPFNRLNEPLDLLRRSCVRVRADGIVLSGVGPDEI